MDKSTKNKHKKIEIGLCPQCGKPNDRDGWYCSNCLVKNRKRRKNDVEFYLECGLCRICGKNKQMPFSTYCEDCSERAYEYARRRYQNNPEYCKEHNRKSQKKRYDECKAEGICTRCRKMKAIKGKTKCGLCLKKDAEQHAIRHDGIPIAERQALNICRFCNNPAMDGKRVCEKHYQMCIEHTKLIAINRKEKS